MTRVTLAQLEAFASIARSGSVHGAARQLNLSQPSVSLRLRDLERALGVKLFERSGRGLQLSLDGIGRLEHANRILDEVDHMKGQSEDGEVSGRVRLGVSESFAVTGLPALLKLIAADHPQLLIDLVIGSSPDLVHAVIEHNLDLAMVINPVEDQRLRRLPLGVQPTIWAAAPGLDLPATIRPADIVHQVILVNPSPYPGWQQTMSWFGAAGLVPPRVSICDAVPSVIAHLIQGGVGLGILPTKLVEPLLRAGTLVALACRPEIAKSYLCAVHHAGERDASLDAVIGATRRILDELHLLEAV
jgi:DNA-binding transcriptional LysR family regulator